MNSAYDYCTNEAGKGSYARMKAGMAAHVDQEKGRMFDSAAKGVRQSLLRLCETVKKAMLDKADGVFVQMQRDYLTLVGVHRGNMKMSREERHIRRKVDEAIDDIDALFQDVVEADIDQLKADRAVGKSEHEGSDIEEAEDEPMDDDEQDDDIDDETGSEGEDAASEVGEEKMSSPPSPNRSGAVSDQDL